MTILPASLVGAYLCGRNRQQAHQDQRMSASASTEEPGHSGLQPAGWSRCESRPSEERGVEWRRTARQKQVAGRYTTTSFRENMGGAIHVEPADTPFAKQSYSLFIGIA